MVPEAYERCWGHRSPQPTPLTARVQSAGYPGRLNGRWLHSRPQLAFELMSTTAFRFAERMSRLGTEGAFEVLARARKLEAEGKKIVHLEIGEPDFATPDNIIEAGISALQNGYTHYTPASGIKEVREAVATFVSRMLKCEIDAAEVVLVPGSKNVLLFTLLATIEPGDEVIMPDPGYPAYHSQVSFIGGVPRLVTLR